MNNIKRENDLDLAYLNHSIIHYSNDAIVSKTLDGTVTSWNNCAESMFGYSAEEMVGQSILKIFPADRRPEEEFLLSQVAEGKLVRHFETERLTKDGRRINVSVSLSPIWSPSGSIVGVAKIARDITDRIAKDKKLDELTQRVTELLRIQTEKLEATQKDLLTQTQFMNSMLRELGNSERKKVEEERWRLSLELHDDVGQMLSALQINLQRIRRKVANADTALPLENSIRITVEIAASLRRIMEGLHPRKLVSFGLSGALKERIASLQSYSGICVDYKDDLGSRRFSSDIEIACFRVTQEAISNALRHANATKLHVALHCDPDLLQIEIRDNGIGFTVGESQPDGALVSHFGLLGMQERMQTVNGRLQIESQPGRGCIIRIQVPLENSGGNSS